VIDATKLTLNETLAELGYKITTEIRSSGYRVKSVLRDGEPIRFREGTIPSLSEATSLHRVTANTVWLWLRATGQIK